MDSHQAAGDRLGGCVEGLLTVMHEIVVLLGGRAVHADNTMAHVERLQGGKPGAGQLRVGSLYGGENIIPSTFADACHRR